LREPETTTVYDTTAYRKFAMKSLESEKMKSYVVFSNRGLDPFFGFTANKYNTTVPNR